MQDPRAKLGHWQKRRSAAAAFALAVYVFCCVQFIILLVSWFRSLFSVFHFLPHAPGTNVVTITVQITLIKTKSTLTIVVGCLIPTLGCNLDT